MNLLSKDLSTFTTFEMNRVIVIENCLKRLLSEKQASEQLWVSTRHVRRLKAIYRAEGRSWMIHHSKWKKSNRKLNSTVINKVKQYIHYELYDWFSPSDLYDELIKMKYSISIESIRQIMIAEWKRIPKKKWLPKKLFRHRTRRSCIWSLIQFDWSYHKRFEDRPVLVNWELVNGPELCLLVAIDDATSNIMMLWLCDSESTENVMKFWKMYCEKFWISHEIYTDNLSTYKYWNKDHDPDSISQFERALWQLWVKLIIAKTPQAKWRVERANWTLQSRLVKALRLAWISNINEANNYMNEVFIPWYNAKYWVEPQSLLDIHRSTEWYDLDSIFAKHYTRVVNNDWTIAYNTNIYQLEWVKPKESVTVELHLDWKMKTTYCWKSVTYSYIKWRRKSYQNNKLSKTPIGEPSGVLDNLLY